MRRRIVKAIFLLLPFLVVIGAPLYLLLIALSDAIDASPKPMLLFGWLFAGALMLLLLYLFGRLLYLKRRGGRKLSYGDRYLDTAELRSEVTLAFGMAVNLLYAVFKLIAAGYFHALLFAAEAFYYLILSAIRLLLVFHAYLGRRTGKGAAYAWKNYRRCGWQLLLLEFAMTFVILQSQRQSIDYVNLSALVYGSAAWAFYRLTAAIVQLIRFRGSDRPLLSASKLINLSAALLSIYVLQNTLLLHFGDEEAFRLRMNLIFGSAVALTVILIALSMIVRGSRNLRSLTGSLSAEKGGTV